MSATRLNSILTTLKKLTDELSRTYSFRGLQTNLNPFRSLRFEWPALRIGELSAAVPVVQGGMGIGVSLSRLASSVAEIGGIGVIAANGIGLIEKDYYKDGRAANLRAFRREIRSARQRSNGILGVNIMVALNDFHQLLDVAIEEKVDIVFMGAGLPIKNIPVERMRANGVKAAPIVSSARATDMIFRMWTKAYNDVPDAVVFEGPMAGGHIGFSEEQIDDPAYQIESVVPQITEVLKPYAEQRGQDIPVIAGGGVYKGEDIHDVLGLGASAVQMGTRFVATEECDADIRFKQAYVDCTPEQIGLIKSPVGMPGRAIRNSFIADSENGDRPAFRCAWQCLASCKAEGAHYCISIALNNARQGRLNQGFVFVGANAHRVERITPVAALVQELAEGYQRKAREKVVSGLEKLVEKVQGFRRNYEKGRRVGMQETVSKQILPTHIADSLADCWALLRQQVTGSR